MKFSIFAVGVLSTMYEKCIQTDDDENILPLSYDVCDNCAINTYWYNSSSDGNKMIIYQTL